LAIPGGKWRQFLQSLGLRADIDIELGAVAVVSWRGDICLVRIPVAPTRKRVAGWRLELELLSRRCYERVMGGIEAQI
jgi:hypothetical protein